MFIVIIFIAVFASSVVGALTTHFVEKGRIRSLERYYAKQQDRIFLESYGAGYKEGIAEGKRQQQLEQILERKHAQN